MAVIPTLRITDYAAAKRFDVDGLGLHVDWEWRQRQRGVLAESAPREQPWGNREMRVRDPDGNQPCIRSVTRPAPARGAGEGEEQP